LLQIGFVTTSTAGFNTGFSFISARVYADHRVEFQSGNGTAVSTQGTTTTAAGTIANGDWLQLVFTTQETASGSFTGNFSLLDYGPTGVAVPTTVLPPTPYTVTALATLGTATAVYAGFRTANSVPLSFDNFMVDSSADKMAFIAQPSTGTAGSTLGTFIAVVQDINSNILVGDTSTVTLTLSHGTFSNGQSTVSATAVNGIATFANLQINASGSYILRATDSNPNLDPGFAPFTINAGTAAKLAFVQQPTDPAAGATISPAVTVAVEDANNNIVTGDTSTVTLTLSSGTFAGGATTVTANAVGGVATFSNLIASAAGSYTLTASDGSLAGVDSNSFTITAPDKVYVSNSKFGLGTTPSLGQVIDGDQGTSGTQSAIYGLTAFTTITSALAIVSSSGTIVVNGGAYAESPNLTESQTLQLTAGDLTLNTLFTAETAVVDLQTNRLTLVASAGSHTIAGAIQGTGGLSKTGADTLTLSGTDTYTGGTSVSAGTFFVTGSLAGSAVSIAAGATLSGGGTVGAVSNFSGTVTPGVAGITLTATGNVTLGPGTLALDLDSIASYDRVAAVGVGKTVTITGTTLSLNVGAVNDNEVYTILTVPGASPASLIGTFNTGTGDPSRITVGSRQFSISYTGGDGNDITLTAMPNNPLSVSGIILNGGTPYVNSSNFTSQHSEVESVRYSFSQPVSLTPGNFTLSVLNNSTTFAPTVALTAGNGTSTDSVWTVTFSGDGVNGATHSIGDGEYRLALSAGSLSNTYDFFRLLGDLDGNGKNDFSDFQSFNTSFNRLTNDPLYVGAADFDGSNTVEFSDFQIFNTNFNHALPTPLPPN
jgi:autotransporter-associated beta strand protein